MRRQFTLRSLLAAQLVLALILALWACLGGAAVVVVLFALCALALRQYLSATLFEVERAYYDPTPLVPKLRVPCRPTGTRSGLRAAMTQYLLQPISVAWLWAVFTAWTQGWWTWRAEAWIERDACFRLAADSFAVVFALVVARHHYSAARRKERPLRASRWALGRTLGECLFLNVISAVGCFSIHFP